MILWTLKFKTNILFKHFMLNKFLYSKRIQVLTQTDCKKTVMFVFFTIKVNRISFAFKLIVKQHLFLKKKIKIQCTIIKRTQC